MTFKDHILLFIKIPQRVLIQKRLLVVLQFLKDIFQPVISCHIIIEPVMTRHGNPGLLAGTAPMPHIVPRSQPPVRSHMVYIHLRGVS